MKVSCLNLKYSLLCWNLVKILGQNRCVRFMLKIFQTKIMKNEEILYLKWKELIKNCSGKRAFHFNKVAPFFDKRKLG